ncbi:hypothetical protein [Variovorax paradoxus]|uniref:PRTase-CE domain-containing protein n=1 Tax=Variovorax paradoxus (strain EPS) TaxID=595537 RepID=E6V737_VARPE|nr:hypothetical protein [Variovorax paradoxus]ADU38333.1 hypothetical protein Varpa_4163 [Variovorax paradoxus EPS]
MNLADFIFAARIAYRFRRYRPQRVSIKSVLAWLSQYPLEERQIIKQTALHLKCVTDSVMLRDLLDRNSQLLRTLSEAKIPNKNIIYVSISEAGSSSHVVLNMLRDQARLEVMGCKLLDAGNAGKLHETTAKLESGAIIYVDDFSGSGTQFCSQREMIGGYIVGNFSEYFLLHTICEEAIPHIAKTGVVVWQSQIHEKHVRPLNEASSLLKPTDRATLVARATAIAKKGGLGYRSLASMIVFERNTPNTVPLVFRGDKGQRSFKGFIPRTTDLPPHSLLL